MATIDNKKIVDDIIAGNYEDDGWIKIVEYTNQGGRQTWGCVTDRERDPDRYERETQYVRNPRVIWRKP
jgi:hypothetical protein